MSSYSEIRTEFKDPDLLVAALKAMGYDGMKLHLDDPQRIENYSWSEKVHIILPHSIAGSSENLGFKRTEDGTFAAVVSDQDRNKYGKNSAWEKSVKVGYAEQNIMRAARAQGLRPLHTGKKLDNGMLEYKYLKG